MLCGDLHEFLLHACLPFVSACPSPPCYYSFARRGRASGWWRRWICLLRRRGHPGGVRPQAVPSARFCSVSFRSPVVASPPRHPGPPARPAPHVAHQPDPNAATATRGAVGSRSRSVAACPQHTTTANKARPKPAGLAAAAPDADAGQEEYHSGAIRAGPENWSGRSISALCWLATRTERQGRDGCCRPSATATVVRLWGGAGRGGVFVWKICGLLLVYKKTTRSAHVYNQSSFPCRAQSHSVMRAGWRRKRLDERRPCTLLESVATDGRCFKDRMIGYTPASISPSCVGSSGRPSLPGTCGHPSAR